MKIALGAVDGTMLADDAVSDQHVADDADIAPTKIAGTAVTLAGAETLTNKALTNPTLQIRDSDLTIIDDGDPGYTMRLQLSPPIDRTAGSCTLTMPDADGTIALEGYVDAEIAKLAHSKGWALRELRDEAGSLEDFFVHVTYEQNIETPAR